MTTLIAVEFGKLRTTRSPWVLLAVTQLVIVGGISGAMVSGSDPRAAATAVKLLGHVGVASLFTLLAGVVIGAGEYRHRTVTDTFLATPRRERVVAAKLVAGLGGGVVFGLAGCVTAVVAAATWLSAKGGSLDPGSATNWRVLLGGVLWNAAFGAIGAGLGLLVRNLVVAVAAALAWLALVEGIVGQLLGSLGRWLPFEAGSALALAPSAGSAPLPQWGAGLVLAGYAVLFAALAVSATVRSDVS
jgi:ABC-2 type transport system permease protein